MADEFPRPECETDEPAWPCDNPFTDKKSLEKFLAAGIELHPGDRVRLRPRGGADILDLALAGKSATITAIEQDYENNIHLAVTVDDDPGKDFGITGKPGHRFFFRPDEIELLTEEPS